MKTSPKAKFIPPLKTAASYLKKISATPEALKLDLKQYPKDSGWNTTSHKKSSTITKFSLLNDRLSLQTSSKLTRDISHLQDLFHTDKSEPELAPINIHVLPINIDQLKSYMNASSKIQSKSKDKRPNICFKEGCLENINDPGVKSSDFKIFDENFIGKSDLGLPSGLHDIYNLREWFRYMKDNYISKIVHNGLDDAFTQYAEYYNSYEIIVKAGLKECIRQISVQNYERGDLLLDLIKHYNRFWKSKCKALENLRMSQNKENISIINSLNSKINHLEELDKEKDRIVKFI
jgi:hypothetical protein